MRPGEPERAKTYLKNVTDDQNLTELTEIENHVVSGRGWRKWFVSRILAPFIKYGYYDTSTKKVILGDPATWPAWERNPIEDPAVVSTSAAKHSYTATEKIEIVSISRVNNNRAFYVTLSIETSGGTERDIGTVPNNISGNDPGAGQMFNMTANFQKAMEPPFIIDTDDQIHITDEAFVAADSCLTVIVYRKVDS